MKLEKIEIVKFGPYRFVGKSVYARAGMYCGQGSFAGYLWDNSKWVFDKLDTLKDYATDEIHNAAFLTWQKYDGEGVSFSDMFCGPTRLLGYTVGRFMKADTPVTNLAHGAEGLDYFDIPETFVAKGWFDQSDDGSQEGLVKKAVEQHGGYTAASWRFMAEVNGGRGYYIACEKKN